MGMKVTLNGNATSYNNCIAVVGPLTTTAETLITGNNLTGATASTDNFEIAILHDIHTLKAGAVFQASATQYAPESTSFLYWADALNYYGTTTGNPQATVTITSVSSTYISGTFSGAMSVRTDPNFVADFAVTGGSFTAKIAQ